VLTLRERLAGGGRLMSRLERYGPAECGVCGGASLPGRLYCSSRCRYLARYRGQALRVELDGIKATPLEHARRIGMGRSTLYRRLQLGLDPATALTVPVGAWAAQK
jgi:predicted nucleic acid-binding Zn ribbon protein